MVNRKWRTAPAAHGGRRKHGGATEIDRLEAGESPDADVDADGVGADRAAAAEGGAAPPPAQRVQEVAARPKVVLHQGRGQMQRDVMDPMEQIRRTLCKHFLDDQTESYLLNPPPAPLLSAAGFDHTSPSTAYAAHLSVEVDGELIKALPKLLERKRRREEEEGRRAKDRYIPTGRRSDA